MKTSNKILTTTFLVLLMGVISTMAYVASNTTIGKTISAEGKISKRYHDIKDLHTLNIRNGQITLHQGEPYVEIKCADNIHQYLETEVKDGALYFELLDGAYDDIGTIDVTISTKDIKNINLTGISSLSAKQVFKTEIINISAEHNTSINLPLEANIVNVSSADGGEITLSGQAKVMNATVYNSGNINASSLDANVVNATASDGSKLITTVKEKLVIDVSNSGEVLYKGEPEITINKQTDSGKITKL